MKQNLVYLDNNASTACAPEVLAAMLPYLTENYGNANSEHYAGRVAYRAVQAARQHLAQLLEARPQEVFFTSGATEANNWIFLSLLKSRPVRRRIVVSCIEHKSVLEPARALLTEGFELIELPVDSDGVVNLHSARELISSDTLLVSVHSANNETGVIQPIAELLRLSHAQGALFHCDAVQSLGKSSLNLAELPVDSASFSAHKIHGPKGVGALFLRGGSRHWPFAYPFFGGGQEYAVRPGTLNVPGIVGFGKAAELLYSKQDKHIAKMRSLQRLLESELLEKIPGSIIHGAKAERLPNTTNCSIPNVPADIITANMPLFCIGRGAACDNGTIGNSHVLKAMNCNETELRNNLRISTSVSTTEKEILSFAREIKIQRLEFLKAFKEQKNVNSKYS